MTRVHASKQSLLSSTVVQSSSVVHARFCWSTWSTSLLALDEIDAHVGSFSGVSRSSLVLVLGDVESPPPLQATKTSTNEAATSERTMALGLVRARLVQRASEAKWSEVERAISFMSGRRRSLP